MSIASVLYLFFTLLCSAFVTQARLLHAAEPIPFFPCGYGGGGRSTAIAVDPDDPRLVLIGSDVAGVFRSTDGGKTFSVAGGCLDGFATADIFFLPFSSHEILLLTDAGLYVSSDDGKIWQKLSSEIQYKGRYPGSRLIVFEGGRLYVATCQKGVFQVRLNPLQIIPLGSMEQASITCLANYKGVLYAGTSRGVMILKNGAWCRLNQGLKPGMTEIANIVVHPSGSMYAVEKHSGLHIWNAKKQLWELRDIGYINTLKYRPRSYKALAVDPHDPNKLLLGTHPESWPYMLFRSANAGRSWQKVERFSMAPDAPESWTKRLEAIEDISFIPGDSRQLYMTDWWNVWKSSDGGISWQQVHRGLQNTVVNDITFHPDNPRKIYLAVADNGLMVSHDAGKTWARKMSGVVDGHAQEIEVSGSNPSKMYLLMNPWIQQDKVFVYKTFDGGETWNDIGFSVSRQALPNLNFVDGLATNLEIDPASDDTVYVATNGFGIFKSTNGGTVWNPANTGITTPYIKGPNALLINPRDPDMLFVSTFAGGIYRSQDAARSWVPVSKKNLFTFAMAIDPANPDRILACCPEKKVIISENAGQSWQEIQLPGRISPHIVSYDIAFHPLFPKLVFFGTLAYFYKAADGLFFSQDGGYAFRKCFSNLPLVTINAIEIPRVAAAGPFIGFMGMGLYRTEIPPSSGQ